MRSLESRGAKNITQCRRCWESLIWSSDKVINLALFQGAFPLCEGRIHALLLSWVWKRIQRHEKNTCLNLRNLQSTPLITLKVALYSTYTAHFRDGDRFFSSSRLSIILSALHIVVKKCADECALPSEATLISTPDRPVHCSTHTHTHGQTTWGRLESPNTLNVHKNSTEKWQLLATVLTMHVLTYKTHKCT